MVRWKTVRKFQAPSSREAPNTKSQTAILVGTIQLRKGSPSPRPSPPRRGRIFARLLARAPFGTVRISFSKLANASGGLGKCVRSSPSIESFRWRRRFRGVEAIVSKLLGQFFSSAIGFRISDFLRPPVSHRKLFGLRNALAEPFSKVAPSPCSALPFGPRAGQVPYLPPLSTGRHNIVFRAVSN